MALEVKMNYLITVQKEKINILKYGVNEILRSIESQ
jgi:hypothetical protein